MSISKRQPMRPALIDAIDAINEGTSGTGTIGATAPINIDTDGRVSLRLDPSTLFVTNDGGLSIVSTLLDVIHETPMLQFGTSNAVSVDSLQQVTVDVTFSHATTEEPLVFVNIQHLTTYGNLAWHVSSVTNQQASIVITNNGTQNVDGITVNWLAISGR